jgi:hypothetical protein
MKRIFLLVVIIIFLVGKNRVFAQCCSPGNPIGGIGNLGVLDAKTVKLILNYQSSRSGKYFDGSKPMIPYFVKSGQYNYVNIDVAFAIRQRLTFELGIGYFIGKTQNYIDGIIPVKKTGYGFSNANATAKVNIFRKNNWELTVGLGLMYPIGPYNKIFDRAIAELDVQPSSGAVNYVNTIFISREWMKNHFRVFLFHRTELKTANPLSYKYGNLYSTSIFTSYSPSNRWDLVFQVRSEIRAKDERPKQIPPYETEKIPVSGSKRLLIAPQINYNISQSFSISIIADIPVYQYYNLQQLAFTSAFSVSLQKRFFKKN